ncbi:TniQ family protein [Vogesella facilis]|uniref:TniQ family protein n=1 Tax=Vogesella facilis TaxID=1655232 RepID=A0ABV7RCI2_9NEIS
MALPHTLQLTNPYTLLFRPAPTENESLAGYLLRLAEANCLGSVREVLALLNQSSQDVGQPSLIPQFSVYSLESLSQSLGHPVEAFRGKILPLDVRIGRTRRFTFANAIWPLDILRYKTRAWCPLCLKEKNFHDAQWDWRIVTWCPHHQILLMERCPGCQQPVYWRSTKLKFCACGYCLCDAQTILVERVPQIERIASLQKTAILRWLTLILISINDGLHRLDTKTLAVKELPVLHEIVATITPNDLHEPCAFQKALISIIEQRYKRYPALGPRFSTCPILMGLNIDIQFDNELKTIATNWLQSKSPPPKLKATDFKCTEDTPLSLEVLAHTLNVSKHIIRGLLKKRVLEPICHANTVNPNKNKMISASSLARLQSALTNTSHTKELTRIINFKKLSGNSSKYLILLRSLLLGTTRAESFNASIGLPSLIIKTPAIDTKPSGILTVNNVAQSLGIYVDAIYQVVATGLLPSYRDGKKKIRIDPTDLITFRSKYVFIREIAQKFNCNPTNLADKLMSAGLKPVHGPTVDGGLVYIFRRDEAEQIGLQKIVLSTDYKSRCGRGHILSSIRTDPGILSSTQACAFLKINPQQLAKICQAGLLKATFPIEYPRKHHFHKKELQDYMARFIENPRLIPLEKAQQQAGLSRLIFRRLIINTGLVNIVSDGIRQYCHDAQLNNAIQTLSGVVTPMQLSKLTGLSVATIRNEARHGYLAEKSIQLGKGKHGLLFPKEVIEIIKINKKSKILHH